jgi:hypothetical protein
MVPVIVGPPCGVVPVKVVPLCVNVTGDSNGRVVPAVLVKVALQVPDTSAEGVRTTSASHVPALFFVSLQFPDMTLPVGSTDPVKVLVVVPSVPSQVKETFTPVTEPDIDCPSAAVPDRVLLDWVKAKVSGPRCAFVGLRVVVYMYQSAVILKGVSELLPQPINKSARAGRRTVAALDPSSKSPRAGLIIVSLLKIRIPFSLPYFL